MSVTAVSSPQLNDVILRFNSVVVSKHEHDGNELQVTEGFRSHVARKLDNLLNR